MSAWIPAALPWKFGVDIRLTETSQRQELRRVSCWGKGFMKFCCDIRIVSAGGIKITEDYSFTESRHRRSLS
ncbi:uncharacterized protein ARMOST_18452 [Armillaria ostoyae]|uniref:Uncharacterized protein n=1 Tax=Armillaria ostoyae TaxID=47428 RepID=A0A284S1V0_ARMOS|nr:uncharacterized protein ARMOST_18452 [Armillaria ostoyae]